MLGCREFLKFGTLALCLTAFVFQTFECKVGFSHLRNCLLSVIAFFCLKNSCKL